MASMAHAGAVDGQSRVALGVAEYIDAGDLLNVTLRLLQRSYYEFQSRKVWGGRFLRVWREVERAESVPTLQ